MPGESIRFNCGEYLPGLQPIGSPGVLPPVPPVIIIQPSSGEPATPYVPNGGPTYTPGNPVTPPPNGPVPGRPITPNIPPTTSHTPTTTIDIRNTPLISLTPPVNVNSNTIEGTSTNQIYHPVYNMFESTPTNTVGVANNSSYRDIFGETVTLDVRYFLNNNGTNNEWIETPFFNLNQERLESSLNKQLLHAFSNIHYYGGIRVDKKYFIDMVKRLLTTNRLNELDPAYFIDLARKQANDEFIEFKGIEDKALALRASLGLISRDAKDADYTKVTGFEYQQLKRQKRLPTDVNASVEVTYSVEEVATVGVFEEGLEVSYLSGTSSLTDFVPLGEGAGYYLGVTSPINAEIPFELTTDVSSSYYCPADLRFNTLKMLSVDPSLTFTVSSTSGVTEFNGNLDYSSLVTPLYFKLELSSISDGDRVATLMDTVVAHYTLIDSSSIPDHANTYGYSVTKLNIDYRDPFLFYARDSGRIDFEQYDLTFREFDSNRASLNNSILTRTLPFAIVLTPGCGTHHNPFDSTSKITYVDNNYVVRSMDCIPHLVLDDNPMKDHALEEKNLFNETGSFKVGLMEANDGQAITYRLNLGSNAYSKSFFSAGIYTSGSPQDATLRGASNVVKNVIDYLLYTYDPEFLTWWDVLSRLSLNEATNLIWDYSKVLHDYLALGGRGVNIINVLNRGVNQYTGITSSLEVDDIPVVSAENRANIRFY